MIEHSTGTDRPVHWGWWLAGAVLAVGLIIDLIDGAPLKLATSSLLFAAFLGATSRPPRPRPRMFAIIACVAGAIGLVLYRMFGPGL